MAKTDMAPSSMPSSIAEMEDWVIERATLFSVAEKRGQGQTQRTDYPTLAAAIQNASGDPRKMVYAATEAGRAVMIGPKQYEHALQIVGTKT